MTKSDDEETKFCEENGITHPVVRKNGLGDKIVAKKKEYTSSLTMHGIPRIFTGSRTESWFWFMVLITFLTVGIIAVSQLIRKYFQYHVYTEVNQHITAENYFPSFTICNQPSVGSIYFNLCGYEPKDFGRNLNETCENTMQRYPSIQKNLKSQFQWSNGYYDIKQCSTWGNKDCANDNHILSLTRFNNTCITLNYNGDFYDTYGHIDLVFNAQKDSRLIVIIHDPEMKEIDVSKQYFIDPNIIYDFKIGKTLLTRLPHPFPTNCTDKKLGDIFPGKYTRHQCIESMEYINMLKECGGIYDYHKAYIPKDILEEYWKYNQTLKTVLTCLSSKSKKITEDHQSFCPIPCKELELPATVTTNQRTQAMIKSDGNEEVYRIGFQMHNVDSYTKIEEKQLYHPEQILSEVGGLFGLVLGASLISFIELFFYLILYLLQKFLK